MPIKKGTSLLLAFLVLFSSAGLAFTVHFCAGDIAHISSSYIESASAHNTIASSEPETCCAVKIQKNDCCCKNRVIKAAANADVIVKVFSFQIEAPFLNNESETFAIRSQTVGGSQDVTSYYCNIHAPPLYELHSQLIFYA